MLHARKTTEAQKQLMRTPSPRPNGSHEAPWGTTVRSSSGDLANRQVTYGNQAMLRRLNSSAGSSGLLQRKCGCGGSCSGCQQRESSALESNSIEPVVRTSQRMSMETPEDKYLDGVLMTLQGSGTCINGTGDSVCDKTTGIYKIIANNNTCCTRGCTQNHEITHAVDATNWGCCKALSVAFNAAQTPADQNAAVQKYNDWMAAGARDRTECNAYSNDIVCANEMAIQKDCNGAGRGTDCCKDIADYKARYSAFAQHHCGLAPRDAPPCPAF